MIKIECCTNYKKLDGYYIYVEHSFESLDIQTISWYIPECLCGNETVKSRMKRKLFEELLRHINGIKVYNLEINRKYLDSEKELLLKKKKELKWKCHQIITEINEGLSPYHWEMKEDKENNHYGNYMIGLFTGKNRMAEDIEKL